MSYKSSNCQDNQEKNIKCNQKALKNNRKLLREKARKKYRELTKA